jgi:hypothetical protein
MTSQEIYQLASETTDQQFNNLLNGFNKEEENTFNTLVRLGDCREVALWTVIAERYNTGRAVEIYKLAYEI